MDDIIWNFPSQLPEVSEEMQSTPTDIGWGNELVKEEDTTSE